MIWFPSKKDLSLTLFVWIPMIGIPGYLIFELEPKDAFIIGGIFLLLNSFTLWIWLDTYYKFKSDSLFIKTDPFHWEIPYQSIEKIIRTRNPLSSPALSFDRLEITHEKDTL